MADKPIIFSGKMVEALVAGRKTQTRRIIPTHRYDMAGYECTGRLVDYERQKGFERHGLEFACSKRGLWDRDTNPDGKSGWYIRVPIRTGDRLWVRENFAKTPISPISESIDNPMTVYPVCDNTSDYGGPWKPSIHMPRTSSRITLMVTDVRVQRLDAISAEDCEREGIKISDADQNRDGYMFAARIGFRKLWESINGAGSWDDNPWVAAYTFTVEKMNIDKLPKAA